MTGVDRIVGKSNSRQQVISTFYLKEAVSKRDVIDRTGLSPASVNNLMEGLISDGILEETELGQSSGGRPPMLYRISDGVFNVINYKVTGDSIIAAICDHFGKVLFSKTLSMKIQGEDSFKSAFSKVTDEMRSDKALFDSIKAVGITLPGILSYSDCFITLSNPLKLVEFDTSRMVEDVFGKPMELFLFKDSDTMLLAEFYFGSIKASNMAYVYIDKGIGFSIITNNHLFYSDNCGMELGHTVIDINGKECGCGIHGCANTLLGKNVAINRYLELSSNKVIDVEKLDFQSLYQMSISGDESAKRVIDEQIIALGTVLVNVVNIFNPGEIILGGGITSTPEIASRAEEFVKARALGPFAEITHVRASELGITESLKAMSVRISGELFFKQFI